MPSFYLSFFLAILSGVVSVYSLVGHILSERWLVTWAAGEPMAPNTALALGALSVSHLLFLWYIHNYPYAAHCKASKLKDVEQQPQADYHERQDAQHRP